MAKGNEKVIAVRLEVTGLTEESRQIEVLNQKLSELANEKKKYNDIVKSGGKLSEEQKVQLAALSQKTRDLTEEKKRLVKTETDSAKAFTANKGSMEALRAKTAQLRDEANKLNLTTVEGQKRFKEIERQIHMNTNRIRDYDRSLSGSSTLVGEYSLGIKKAFTAIGIAIASAYTVLRTFKTVIESTQFSADAFNITMADAKQSVDSFFIAITSGDWTNFIDRLKESRKSARELAETMDVLGDIRRGLSIEESELENEKDQLLIKLRDKTGKITIAEKKKLYDRLVELDEGYNARVLEAAYRERDALLKLYSGITGLREDRVYEIIKNYGDYEDRFNDAVTKLNDAKRIWGQLHDVSKEPFDVKQYLAGISDVDRLFTTLYLNYGKLNDTKLDRLRDAIVAVNQALGANQDTILENMRIYNEVFKTGIDKAKESVDGLIKSLGVLIEAQFELAMTEGSNLLYPREAIKAEVKGPAAPAMVRKYGEAKTSVETGKGEDILTAEQRQNITAIGNLAMQTADAVFSYKKALLDRQMAAELAGAIGNEAQIAKIRQKYAKEQQKIAIGEAIIKGSLAILNALNTQPFMPMALIMAAMAAILTGIEIATIKKQTFAKGGKITGGQRIRPVPSGDDTLILAKQGEMILNERQQRILGGAATFKRMGLRGFAEGGLVGRADLNYQSIRRPIGAADLDYQPIARQLNPKDIAQELAKIINDKEVHLVMSDLEKAQGTRSIIKQSSKF